jgi:TRAP-type mannitol/chloroaromatic compound transport system permease small subunit
MLSKMQPNQPKITLDLETIEAKSARGDALTLPRTALSDRLDAAIDAVGGILNWIWIVLVVIIVVNVVGRYAFAVNFIWVEEVQWHMYAVGFMLGIGYAVRHDAHVRVDVLAMTLRPRSRAWIELFGILLLIVPVVVVILINAFPFVISSWERGEQSSAPGGLTNRWAIKSVILLAFVYLGTAALSRLLRVCAYLFGVPQPRAET